MIYFFIDFSNFSLIYSLQVAWYYYCRKNLKSLELKQVCLLWKHWLFVMVGTISSNLSVMFSSHQLYIVDVKKKYLNLFKSWSFKFKSISFKSNHMFSDEFFNSNLHVSEWWRVLLEWIWLQHCTTP